MLKIEINVVGAQALERAFHRPTDRFRSGIRNERIGTFAAREVKANAKFCRNLHLVAHLFQSFANKPFILMGVVFRTIHLRRVKKGVPRLKGFAEHAHCFFFVKGFAISMGKPHATIAKSGY